MKKVITYGTYDLLHYGHVALLERAKKLGDYLIVGVTSDAFDKGRGKLNVQQSVVERIEAVKATGLADEIIVEEYEGQKISDIKKYNVDIFAIGSDWLGKFDYLNEWCQVVYLKRTEGISSTEIRANKNPIIRMGIVGTNNPVERVLVETKFVNGLDVVGLFAENTDEAKKLSNKYEIQMYENMVAMFADVDAVYVVQSINKHSEIIKKALNQKCHVLCESPIFMKESEAKQAFKLAHEKKVVLFEAIKTMFFPAFEHLMLIVNSGAIGGIRDVEVSCSNIPQNIEKIENNKFQGSMYDWGSIALAPIIKILGTDYQKCTMYNFTKNDYNYFVKGILEYEHATATFKAGKGIKTEGNMIITGTKGYIYVPAPWWKTDYFEIRFEDLRETKKYFYKYDGEGFRYELLEFIKMINEDSDENYFYSEKEILSIVKLIEQFDKQLVNKKQ